MKFDLKSLFDDAPKKASSKGVVTKVVETTESGDSKKGVEAAQAVIDAIKNDDPVALDKALRLHDLDCESEEPDEPEVEETEEE